jgi:hypothetical protein
MMLAGSRLLCIVALALATGACQSDDLPPQPSFVSYSRDQAAVPLRQGSALAAQNGGKPYFIEFRSRYALTYGHTYVVFGRAAKNGGMINPEVAGLHPASTSEVPYVLGHFLPVPAETGWSDGDLEEQYRSASWRVMLTEAEYNDVVGYIRDLQARSTTWNATVYNCNAFTGNIARHMGYETPSKWLRPQQFVTELREMNVGSNAAGGTESSATSAGPDG